MLLWVIRSRRKKTASSRLLFRLHEATLGVLHFLLLLLSHKLFTTYNAKELGATGDSVPFQLINTLT